MIGMPFNDIECLATISRTVAQMAEDRDPIFSELAAQYPTSERLVEYIRSLPQRDDLGDPTDGPRVEACSPPQRVRFGAADPNCVERAALFIGVEEMRDAGPTRQLATVDTPVGMHTFPLVNGRPVVLDPRVTKDCVECGLALSTPGPLAIEPRNAIAWTVDMASAGAGELRNGDGPSAIYIARNAIRRLLERSAVPAESEVDAMAVLFALAERIARRYGGRALAIVRTTARAIADLIDGILANRNASWNLAGYKFDTPQWLDQSATAAGKVGLDLGSLYLNKYLAGIGIGKSLIGLVESRFGEQGRTLGALAHPPEMATFEKFAAPRIGGE